MEKLTEVAQHPADKPLKFYKNQFEPTFFCSLQRSPLHCLLVISLFGLVLNRTFKTEFSLAVVLVGPLTDRTRDVLHNINSLEFQITQRTCGRAY